MITRSIVWCCAVSGGSGDPDAITSTVKTTVASKYQLFSFSRSYCYTVF